MKVVDPYKPTTLVLNAAYMPTHVIGARFAFHCIWTSRVKPMDKHTVPYDDFDLWVNTAEMFDDQPSLRSAHQQWPVPTIVLASNSLFKSRPKKGKGKTSLFELVRRYDYTCQITGRKFKKNWRKHFTIEHVIPVCKGGPNEDWNLLPTCREANIKKADTFPYFDVNGVDLSNKIKKTDTVSIWIDPENMRPEWEPFPQVKVYAE